MHSTQAPSSWVERWAHLVPAGGAMLDVACGEGRHMRFFASRGHAVTGVDRDEQAVEAARRIGETLLADIESGPWPFAGRAFNAVVVTNYLWRPLLADIVGCVAPGGVLIYETFAIGNESVGKPSRPDFLLAPGELLSACEALRVIAYEDGFLGGPDRFVQRVVAVREQASVPPPRYALEAPSPNR